MFCSWLKSVLGGSLSLVCLAAFAGCVQQPAKGTPPASAAEKAPAAAQSAGVAEKAPAAAQPAAANPSKPGPEAVKTAPVAETLPKPAAKDAAEPPKSLAAADNEEQWEKFFKDASKEYGFSEAQAQGADAALQSCLKRAATRREEHKETVRVAQQAKDAAAVEKADDTLRAVLVKLGNESMSRIDAIASVEQVEKAAKAGFESPRRKNPGAKPEVGFVAPPFELKAPDDKLVSLEALKGKVVVLHFWATWCGFCKKSMPDMAKLYDTTKDNPKVVIYGVNCSQRPNNPDPVAYAKEQGCGYQILLNGDDVSHAYEVQGFPTLYVIGPDGKVIYKERGMQPDVAPRLEPVIKKALEDYGKPAKG